MPFQANPARFHCAQFLWRHAYTTEDMHKILPSVRYDKPPMQHCVFCGSTSESNAHTKKVRVLACVCVCARGALCCVVCVCD